MNIVEPVLYQCKVNPFATAIATPGSGLNSVRYGHLEKLIHNIARAAIKEGLTPGDVTAVSIGDGIFHAAVVLGLMRIGVVTMSLGEPSLPNRIPVDAVVTDSPQIFADTGKAISLNASWFQGDGSPLDYDRIYRSQGGDGCRISLTSGSTGRPKGVLFTHEVLAERMANDIYTKGPLLARSSRLFSSLGVNTSPGFRYMLNMLLRGGTVYFPGRDPSDIVHYLAAYRVQALALSPHNLHEYLTLFEADPALESPFEVVVCQGARLAPALADRARARLSSNFFTSYGSTETKTVASGPAHALRRISGAVGFVCPGVTVEVTDGENRPLPPGREGTFRIRTPHLVSGYVGDPESTAEVFRDGAFYSGDLGYVTPDGIMVVTGRQKTALSISGNSVAPEIIEEVLCAYPGVSQAAAFTFEDGFGISRMHALIVAPEEMEVNKLREHCDAKLRDVFVPQSFIRVDAVPRGSQGKIDRRRVGELASGLMKKS